LLSFMPCLFFPAAVWMRLACDLQEAYLIRSGVARQLCRSGGRSRWRHCRCLCTQPEESRIPYRCVTDGHSLTPDTVICL
jgi:hypothetical protein